MVTDLFGMQPKELDPSDGASAILITLLQFASFHEVLMVELATGAETAGALPFLDKGSGDSEICP